MNQESGSSANQQDDEATVYPCAAPASAGCRRGAIGLGRFLAGLCPCCLVVRGGFYRSGVDILSVWTSYDECSRDGIDSTVGATESTRSGKSLFG